MLIVAFPGKGPQVQVQVQVIVETSLMSALSRDRIRSWGEYGALQASAEMLGLEAIDSVS